MRWSARSPRSWVQQRHRSMTRTDHRQARGWTSHDVVNRPARAPGEADRTHGTLIRWPPASWSCASAGHEDARYLSRTTRSTAQRCVSASARTPRMPMVRCSRHDSMTAGPGRDRAGARTVHRQPASRPPAYSASRWRVRPTSCPEGPGAEHAARPVTVHSWNSCSTPIAHRVSASTAPREPTFGLVCRYGDRLGCGAHSRRYPGTGRAFHARRRIVAERLAELVTEEQPMVLFL